MENEKRLIDAKAFDLRVHQKKMTDVFPNWKELPEETKDMICQHGQYIQMLLETQATVDAVEVVRCKDCKHWKLIDSIDPHRECLIFCGLHDYGYLTGADDFCSYGERRTDV